MIELSSSFPPQPSVEHLLTVFRRIDSGSIVVPAFQRAFVWDRAKILSLLESVVNGFPIGSVLLWRSEVMQLRRSESPDIPFPTNVNMLPVYYVLDGLQRLSTLYGVFHFGDRTSNQQFNVWYDLEEQKFVHGDDDRLKVDVSVALSSVFVPRKLLDVQQALFRQSSADLLIERLLWLQSRFQEYMIPIVTIGERNVEQVVKIFERVNSTGLQLGRVDFMRAITWSSSFDLNAAIDSVSEELNELDFAIEDETVVKWMAMELGLEPTSDGLLQLQKKSAKELSSAVDRVSLSARDVVRFFNETMKIYSSAYVPYQAQLLVVFKHIQVMGTLSDEWRRKLRGWVVLSSFAEIFQGRPDHFAARMMRRVGDNAFFEPVAGWMDRAVRQEIGPRRVIRGRAVPAAFGMLLVRSGARSIVDAREIGVREYTYDFDSSLFVPIWPLDTVQAVMGGDVTSARVIGNTILVPPIDRANVGVFALPSLKALARSPEFGDVLASQLLSPDLDFYSAVVAPDDLFHSREVALREGLVECVGDIWD